ncbi:MAG: zinc ribbon domain-containing protein [Gammaproteobacteria bacterium]|nr:zinc ribbon domain-containing protein [Gammaproteobacteria bacterium]
MPIYEYACRSCEHQFETIQKSSEEPLKDCPACGETALRKLLSAPVFRLKGSGWYETDFKTGDRRNVTEGKEQEAGKETEATGNGESADKSADGGTAKESSDASPAAAGSSTNTKTNGKGTGRASGGKSSSAPGGSSASAPDAG